MKPNRDQFAGVFTQKSPALSLVVRGPRRFNDRVFTGPKGAVQRYSSSITSDVVETPYGSAK